MATAFVQKDLVENMLCLHTTVLQHCGETVRLEEHGCVRVLPRRAVDPETRAFLEQQNQEMPRVWNPRM